MPETFKAEVSVTINAPASKVWTALTTPELIKQYLFGTETISDWKVGSPITYKGVWEGKAYEDKGVITKIEPEKILETTYWSSFSALPDSPENYQNIAYVLEPAGQGTKLTITQDNIKSAESRDHSTNNWQAVLESLKNILEK